MSQFEVVTPRPVRKLVDELVGNGLGIGPFMTSSVGTRGRSSSVHTDSPAGPLAPIVCGLHLKRGFRLAVTIQPPDEPEGATRVVILYVGQREPRHAESDVWTVLHYLFGVENPPGGPSATTLLR